MSLHCPTCPRNYQALPATGPQPSDVLVIGERPGVMENKRGMPFIGSTGKELDNTYLPLAGLDRADIRVTNTVRCWAMGNRKPTDGEIASCSYYHLPAEIIETEPKIILLLGDTACRMVPGIRLSMMHGIPHWGRLFDFEGWLIPMFHPALGLHEPKWMTFMLEDWAALPVKLRCASRYQDAYETNYRLLTGREVCDVPLSDPIAIDTESHGKDLFSVQVSSSPSTSFMVLAQDRTGLAALKSRMRLSTGILHNAVHDIDEMDRMDLQVRSFRDTMQESYHLGNLPQGLKALTYRLFGFTMTSWEDTVKPFSLEALNEWMVEALLIAQLDLSLIEVKRLKTKIRETVKKGPLETLLTRLIVHVDPTSDYDPWMRLDEFWQLDSNDWMTSHVEARLGPYPIQGIGNVPLPQAIQYGCGDADWTLQVADELQRMRQSSNWRIAPDDHDI